MIVLLLSYDTHPLHQRMVQFVAILLAVDAAFPPLIHHGLGLLSGCGMFVLVEHHPQRILDDGFPWPRNLW